jgi:hypothetical protein
MSEYLIPTPPSQGSSSKTGTLFLSLFLLILAFFIVLVSISRVQETKTNAVKQSLGTTFQKVMDSSVSDFTVKDSDNPAGKEFQEEITTIFTTHLQVAKIEIVQPGRLMIARMPVSAIFLENSPELNPSVFEFLDRTVAILSSSPPGTHFDMQFIVGVPDGLLSIKETIEMRQAGSFIREILSRGAPPDSLSVGLNPGEAEQIMIRFYVRKEKG